MRYTLEDFSLREMIHAGRQLREVGSEFLCMEGAASAMASFFYDHFGYQDGEDWRSDFVLVRCFKTHAYGALPAELLDGVLGKKALPAETQCLTLLGSRGCAPAWNSRHSSKGHAAIPLETVEMVERVPMVRQLVLQLGLTLDDVVRPSADVSQTSRAFEIFHVEQARGSAIVPAQDEFVIPYDVASVLGFGGLLPAGEMFVVLLFTRVPVGAKTAALFRTLALGVKLSLLPFSGKRIFAENGLPVAGGAKVSEGRFGVERRTRS